MGITNVDLVGEGLSSLREESWLYKYLKYTNTQESPTKFHLWSGISAISSALGRSCYIFRGYYTLFPNQYIILVAESARCRKSTSADIAIDDILETTQLCDIVREKLTVEYMCKLLSEGKSKGKLDNSIVIYASELATFLGASAFMTGLIPVLTSFYNAPKIKDYRTKTAGVFKLENVCINLVGCTTLDWMSNNMPGDSIEGGFTGRVIFVVCEDPRLSEPWPYITNEQVDIRHGLMTDLIRIGTMIGEFSIEEDAKDAYSTWYRNRKEPEDIRIRGYDGRVGDHVLKVAMVLSASDDSSMVINKRQILLAIKILNKNEEKMHLAFRGASFSKSSKDNDRILAQIEKAGGSLEHWKLAKKNNPYLNAAEFKLVMDTLRESREIKEVVNGKKRTYHRL